MNENGRKLLIWVGAFVSVLLLAGTVEKDGLFGQTTAAWIQAIGSVGAIAGAAWLAGDQARRDDARRKTDARAAQYSGWKEGGELLSLAIVSAENASGIIKTGMTSISEQPAHVRQYCTVIASIIRDRKADLDSLVNLAGHSSGARPFIHNLRASVGATVYVLDITLLSLGDGVRLDAAGMKSLRGGLANAANTIEGHVELAKVVRDHLREEIEAERRRLGEE